jgi:transposase
MRTGIAWRDLPPMFGKKSSVHRRFQEWVNQGVFDKILKHTLKLYDKKKGISTKRMAADGSYSRAPKGGLTPEQIQQTVVNTVLKNISW